MTRLQQHRHIRRVIVCLGAILVLLGAFAANAYADVLKVHLYVGGGSYKPGWWRIEYDDGIGSTLYKRLKFTDPVTGRSNQRDTYCLQPTKPGPEDDRDYSADLINLQTASDNYVHVAKVLYFADGGPGESKLRSYLKDHKKKYPDFQSDKAFYGMMHMILAYAYDPDQAFELNSNCSTGKASAHKDSYVSDIKALYRWCLANVDTISDPSFQINYTKKDGNKVHTIYAVYDEDRNLYTTQSKPFQVSGSSKQSFRYTVPSKTTLYVTHRKKTTSYKAGTKNVEIFGGDSFWFAFTAKNTVGIPKKTVTGVYSRILPYKVTISGKQNVASFINTQPETAWFAVSMPEIPQGYIKIQKRLQSASGEVTPEANVEFHAYLSDRFDSYQEAVAAGKNAIYTYAAKLVTGTDGKVKSPGLYPGTYTVEQISSTAKYAMMEPNPGRVTVQDGSIAILGGGWITDLPIEEYGNLQLRKSFSGGASGDRAVFDISLEGVTAADQVKATKSVTGEAPVPISTQMRGDTWSLSQIALGDGGSIYLSHIPVGAKYVITEHASEGYRPSYHAYPSAAVRSTDDTGEQGKDLTVTDTIPTRDSIGFKSKDDLTISYDWNNSNEIFHTLQLEKVSAGTGADAQDVFTFQVTFSALQGRAPGYAVYSGEGEDREVTDSRQSKADTAKSLVYTLRLRAGDTAKFTEISPGARYRITEKASRYRPSYQVAGSGVQEGEAATGKAGQSLSTGIYTMPGGETAAAVTVHFTNEAEETPPEEIENPEEDVLHSLLITKQSTGADRNPGDYFFFRVDFSDLGRMPADHAGSAASGFAADGGETAVQYRIPGYRDSHGETEPSRSGEESSCSMTIRLRDGESIRFTDISAGVRYRITELENDYVPSYRVTEEAGTIPNTEGEADANMNLSTGWNAFPAKAEEPVEPAFVFTNESVPEPVGHTLEVTKHLDATDHDRFSYHVELEGLEEGSSYAAVLPGSKTYTLQTTAGGASVKQGTEGVAGVHLILTRSDQKQKILTTGPDGSVRFDQLHGWLHHVSGTATITWPGGRIPLSAAAEDQAEHLQIETIQADGRGRAALDVTLGDGETMQCMGLPPGASYRVQEQANEYAPAYEIQRLRGVKRSMLDAASGESRQRLTTAEVTFPEDGSSTDTVCFTNQKESRRLRVTKDVRGNTEKTFLFTAALRGLGAGTYYAITSGDASCRLTVDTGGNMTVTVTGTDFFRGRSMEGIPVKLIRADGQVRTLYTNAEGKIPRSRYTQWLQAISAQHYTVEFLGEQIDAQWREAGEQS